MEMLGGCFCGKIRFRVDGNPKEATVCHCTDCQRFSGSSFMPGGSFKLEQFHMLNGEPSKFSYAQGCHRFFCSNCGSQLFFASDKRPEMIEIFSGSLDDPNQLPPDDHTFCKSKVSWLHLSDQLPQYEVEP